MRPNRSSLGGEEGLEATCSSLDGRLPAVRTHLPLAPHASAGSGEVGVGGGHAASDGQDSWDASGPFRGAPLGYVLHGTPSGTPLASPRNSALPSAEEGAPYDLEAPLLHPPGSSGPINKRQGDAFLSSGIIQPVVFGLINTAAGVPALIAFCAVVFKDPLYDLWLEPLCKFFFLSSAIHQALVSWRSAVPHAVGQVQDVGLIFLSAMASSIAADCTNAGLDASAALGTALLTMAACTLIVGLGLIAVAKANLAAAVNYIPLPAVGGYLSYVGYFCLASGLGLGGGIQLGPPKSWLQLWDLQVVLRVLPTLGSCFAMMWTVSRFKHPMALPAALVLIVGLFHGVLLAAGVSLQEAQEAGWVLQPAASGARLWELWSMFDMPHGSLQNIYWPAALQQVGKLVGLFMLVCFGSCMDIAAIQQDTPFRLDFDRELTTIGLSNMLAGAAGCGFTGSFIFSQTIFTGRAGVHSRLNGAVIALCEFGMAAVPFSLVQYLPCFFFGSLLVWFGVEIMRDWMIMSYHKLSIAEYALLWATFAAIMEWGLEAGIAAGCICSTFYFVYAYAKSQLSSFSLSQAQGQSGIVRAPHQEAALQLLRPAHMATARLPAFLFFGVANAIGKRLHTAAENLETAFSGGSNDGSDTTGGNGNGGGGNLQEGASGDFSSQPACTGPPALRRLRSSLHAADRLYADSSKHGGALHASLLAPKFFVLDFTRVRGIDATAARTLGTLFRDLTQLSVTPVVTAANHAGMRQLLIAHGMPLPPVPAASADEASPFLLRSAAELGPALHCHEFASYEEGIRFAEGQLLAVAVRFKLCRAPSEAVTLEQLLHIHANQAGLPFACKEESSSAATAIQSFCTTLRLYPCQRLWEEGDPADAFYIIEQGRVTVQQLVASAAAGGTGGGSSFAGQQAVGPGASSSCDHRGVRHERECIGRRVFEFGPGCIAGVVDVYLHRPRSSSATVSSPGAGGGSGTCRVLQLTREALGRMAAEAPAAMHMLQAVVVRAKCLDLGMAAELAATQRG